MSATSTTNRRFARSRIAALGAGAAFVGVAVLAPAVSASAAAPAAPESKATQNSQAKVQGIIPSPKATFVTLKNTTDKPVDVDMGTYTGSGGAIAIPLLKKTLQPGQSAVGGATNGYSATDVDGRIKYSDGTSVYYRAGSPWQFTLPWIGFGAGSNWERMAYDGQTQNFTENGKSYKVTVLKATSVGTSFQIDIK